MNIVLTEAARRQLILSKPNDGRVLRIDAVMSGGCGVSVRLSIVWEEPRRNDTILSLGDALQLHIDRFTERYIEEKTIVDYTEAAGFVFGNRFDAGCTT